MSEIKGQLLGVILAIAMFGVLLGILTSAFRSTGSTVASRMDDAVLTTAPAQTTGGAPGAAL